MTVTVELDDVEMDALQRKAYLEGRSVQDVAADAICAYIEPARPADLLENILGDEGAAFIEALDRLGQ
jgi:hypothetical protein